MSNEGESQYGLVQQRLLFSRLYDMLEEDVGFRDVTTSALVSPTQQAQARLFTQQPGVVAGIELAATFLTELGCSVSFNRFDGVSVKRKDVLLEATGLATTLLTVERTILNLLQRMSGIATLTAKMVSQAQRVNPKVRIASTRKTAPLLRIFDKLAVIAGGGDPHRWRLDDAVLIKDNHLVFWKSVPEAVTAARKRVSFSCPIEVEVSSKEDALATAQAGADAILLDNLSPNAVSIIVQAIKQLELPHPPILEVSGNITLETVTDYAATGVDVISVGILTHSVSALDLSFDLTPLKKDASKRGKTKR